jgi:hypothetical protein
MRPLRACGQASTVYATSESSMTPLKAAASAAGGGAAALTAAAASAASVAGRQPARSGSAARAAARGGGGGACAALHAWRAARRALAIRGRAAATSAAALSGIAHSCHTHKHTQLCRRRGAGKSEEAGGCVLSWRDDIVHRTRAIAFACMRRCVRAHSPPQYVLRRPAPPLRAPRYC